MAPQPAFSSVFVRLRARAVFSVLLASVAAGVSGWLSVAASPLQAPPPACGYISITPDAALPNGVVGVAYSQQLTATGGEAPYTFSIAQGSAPSGLSLSGGGLLTGTPRFAGIESFQVRVEDALGCASSQDLAPVMNSPGTSGTHPVLDAAIFRSIRFTAGGSAVAGNSILTGRRDWGFSIFNHSTAQLLDPTIAVAGNLPGGSGVVTPANTTFTFPAFPVFTQPLLNPTTVTDGTNAVRGGLVATDITSPEVTGFDSTRSVSPLTVPSGGTTQIVTVTVALTDERYASSSFTPNVNVNVQGTCPAPPKAFGLDEGETIAFSSCSVDGSGIAINGAKIGKPYTFTFLVDVPNFGGPVIHEPAVSVQTTLNRLPGFVEGSSVTIVDNQLSGNSIGGAEFSVPATVEWHPVLLDTFILDYPETSKQACEPMTLGRLPDGIVGEEYFAALEVINGAGKYTFVVDTKGLPPGIKPAGFKGGTNTLGGIPTTPGFYEFRVDIFDGLGCSASATASLRIVAPTVAAGTVDVVMNRLLASPVPPATVSVPSGSVLGSAYNWTFTMTNIGNTPPSLTNPRITVNSDLAGVTGTLYPQSQFGPITFPVTTSGASLDPQPSPSATLRQDILYTNVQAAFTPGFDSTRQVDIDTIPPGGANQTVTVRITVTDPRYAPAPNVGSVGVAVGLEGNYQSVTNPSNLDQGETLQSNFGSGAFWSIGNPVLNKEYVFTATQFVPNPGPLSIVRRPGLNVTASLLRPLVITTAQSVTLTEAPLGADPQIGGSATFSLDETVDWRTRDTDEQYSVVYERLEQDVKIPTSTSFAVSANSAPAVGGQQRIDITVTPGAPGGPAPTGTLIITVDGGAQQFSPYIGGTMSFGLGVLSVGPHSVNVAYGGDQNYLGSSTSGDVPVAKADAIASVTQPSPYPYGLVTSTMVTFFPAGSVFPTGSISYSIDGHPLQVATIAGSQVPIEFGLLSGGTHTVVWGYSGDGNFNPFGNRSFKVTVDKATPSGSLSAFTVTYGQPFSFTLFLSNPLGGSIAAFPSGVIEYRIDGGPLQSATLVASPTNSTTSTVTVNAGILPGGTHSLSVVYNGDSNYGTYSSTAPFNVHRAFPSMSLASSSNPSFVGDSVTFTATLSAPGGGMAMPGGTVVFRVDGNIASTQAVNLAGVATFSTSSLALGNRNIQAEYGGDTNYALQSRSQTQTVNKRNTTIGVTTSGSPSRFGQPVTFTAQLVFSGPAPTGTVVFRDFLSPLPGGTVGISASGQATLTTSTLTIGPHQINATYNGDANYSASPTSPPVSQFVTTATPTITLTANPSNPVEAGSNVTFNVSVTGPVGLAIGTVTLFDGLTPLTPNISLTGGTGALNTTALSVGTHVVTAVYNGSSIYSSAFTQTTVVVTVTPPPFSQIYPMPEGACICTPLLMNTNTTGLQHWFVKANTSLTLTATAVMITPNVAGTVRARMYDVNGVRIGPEIVASYPSSSPSGTEVSQSLTIPTIQDAIYRVEIATPNSIGQAHYRLKFDGAQAAGTNTPTSPSFEEVHAEGQPAVWLANAAAGEQLELGFFTSTPPAVPGNTTRAVVRVIDTTNPGVPVPLVDLSGAPLGTTATFSTTLPASINQSFRIAPDYAAAATTPRIYALAILETNGHFKLSRANGADLGLYLSWMSGGEGILNLAITSGNVPFTVPANPVTLTITDRLTGAVRGGSLPSGSMSINADAGRYRIDVGVPAGYVATPSSFEIDVLCGETLDINVVITAVTQTTVSAPSIIQGQDGVVTVNVGSAAGAAPGSVLLSVDGGTPLSAPLSGGAAVFTIPGLLAGDHSLAASYPGDGNYLPSGTTGSIHVDPPVATTTTVTSNNNPSLAGTAVTFTATVSPSGATGTVQFKVDGVDFGAPVPVVSGQATSASTTSLSLGPHAISAVYSSGDIGYLDSTGATNQLVYGVPAGGAFVIGDEEALVGTQVTFWSAQWTQNNDLSGTDANSVFKGWATSSTDATWLSTGGNSSNPPATVPTYMLVLVTSTSTKSGSTISGNVIGRAIVHTNPGYAGNPGSTGTGTIVAMLP